MKSISIILIFSFILMGCTEKPKPVGKTTNSKKRLPTYHVSPQVTTSDTDPKAGETANSDKKVQKPKEVRPQFHYEFEGKNPKKLEEVKTFAKSRAELDQKVWNLEVEAQRHEEVFVKLWDQFRNAKDKIQVLADFPFETIEWGTQTEVETYDLGIQKTKFSAPQKTLTHQAYVTFLKNLKNQGFRAIQGEWHHSRFDRDQAKNTFSIVSMELHLIQAANERRIILKGKLRIEWQTNNATPTPKKIALEDLQILERTGKPFFKEIAVLKGKTQNFLATPDIDQDGKPEIYFGGSLYSIVKKPVFRLEQKYQFPLMEAMDGVFADFNKDGHLDFFYSHPLFGALLFPGTGYGDFSHPINVNAVPKLKLPSVCTAGDVDGDGDLDIWLAQYRRSYVDGQMPTPYYNANDGWPSYLLINDGKGNFVDGTKRAGLAKNRHRRTLSGALVDLDEDGDLDLLAANDFSGVEIHLNNGKGQFKEATDLMVDEPRMFGMGLTFGDYNLDGKLDFFVTGMSSTTARRLHWMNLGRKDFPEHQAMRMRMTYGNRMYLGQEKGFIQPKFKDDVARTGWSWGCTSLDFDNDGDQDLFIGNGHISGKTAKDYCTTYWRHDIYTGTSKEDKKLSTCFEQTFSDFQKKGISWNGFEHNRLFMNLAGQGFLEIGFLFGVASEFDSLGIISEDLDLDGKQDLLVIRRAPKINYLHIFRNTSELKNNWIGIQLKEEKNRSPIGAVIKVKTKTKTHIMKVVCGSSYFSQHSYTYHFGLGKETEVEEIEIRWQDGVVARLMGPKVNEYYPISSN